MKSPCFFVEIFAEKRREVCLMRETRKILTREKNSQDKLDAQGRWRAERKKAA